MEQDYVIDLLDAKINTMAGVTNGRHVYNLLVKNGIIRPISIWASHDKINEAAKIIVAHMQRLDRTIQRL